MNRYLTAADVKESLPAISVLIGNKLYDAQISGRMLEYAVVTVGQHMRFEYAWQTIAGALNAGRPLIA